MRRRPLAALPWWVFALAAASALALSSLPGGAQDRDALALCQQEVSGWKQLATGQVAILQVENQRLSQQLGELKKQLADAEAKVKPPEPKP